MRNRLNDDDDDDTTVVTPFSSGLILRGGAIQALASISRVPFFGGVANGVTNWNALNLAIAST